MCAKMSRVNKALLWLGSDFTSSCKYKIMGEMGLTQLLTA